MRSIFRFVTVPLSLVACGAFGFFLRDLQRAQPPSVNALAKLVGSKPSPATLSGEAIFKQNYARIMADYERPVKATDLRYAGFGGMLASLGDPHTIYMPPVAATAFKEETGGNFSGIGARLGGDSLGAKASEVFDDGPAYRAGLRKGAIITTVDGKSIVGVDIDKIVGRIKGPEGTTVRLGVILPGSTKPVSLIIRRAKIITPTVSSNVIDGTHFGYLAVSQFSDPTTMQFDHEIAKLEGQGIKGLVIDLRDNPGGLLETAADMLGRFVDDKLVVRMKFRNGNEEVQPSSHGQLHHFTYPIAVLVNSDSASAAEIFSGVLKDYGKATLVGTRTYGKASVQNVFGLIDNSSAKVTIAKYYLPSSGYIGRKVDDDGVMISGGLEPDVKVELNTDVQVEIGDPKTDNQLAKAIDVLKSKTP